MKVIQIEVKDVYGVSKAYPANDAAKLFARIAGTKTLCRETLGYAQQLGFSIQEVKPVSFMGNQVATRYTPASNVKVGDAICFDNPNSQILIDRISVAECDGAIGLHGNDETYSIFLKPTDRIQVVPA